MSRPPTAETSVTSCYARLRATERRSPGRRRQVRLDDSIRILMTITRAAFLVLLSGATAIAKPEVAIPVKLALPGGEGGIGFDDLMFSPALHRVLVPAG